MPATAADLPSLDPFAGRSGVAKGVDVDRFMVNAVICTGVRDHQGDEVLPGGCLTQFHRENPTVLFHHAIGVGGPGSPGHILPVGKAEDEAGNYSVHVTDEAVTADVFFSRTNDFARQVFNLYADGCLRGFSVNAIPLTWSRLPDLVMPGGQGKRCYRYESWALKEFSCTALPVNPEALTLAVQRAMVGGEKMHPMLVASLRPYCLPRNRSVSRGVSLGDGDPENRSAADLKPSERAMVDQHQMIRDHRLANAAHHHQTGDPAAMTAHEAIDDHLKAMETLCADYLETKGHARPRVPGFDEVQECVKAGGISGTARPGQSVLSQLIGGELDERESASAGYKALSAGRFSSELTPDEEKIVSRRMDRIERRLARRVGFGNR